MKHMGVFPDEFVVVRDGQLPGELTEITVNCPDKVGLGCDLTRLVFEFDLSVVKGDLATDGRWCFVVLWVQPRSSSVEVRWSLLKERMEEICPSAMASLLPPPPPVHQENRLLLLQVWSTDRTGLLNDVAQKLWEMEFTIHRVKVTTSPDEKSVNLFFITDNRNKLPWKKRGEELKSEVRELLGDTSSTCELNRQGPEYFKISSLPASFTDDLLEYKRTPSEIGWSSCGAYKNQSAFKADIQIDDTSSPLHNLLQVTCQQRKGLLYDCLRTVRDLKLQVAHMRIATLENGNSEISVWVVKSDGRKLTDKQEMQNLLATLQDQIEQPLRIKVVTRGLDTELLVATPIESCGRGRPRVVYDVSLALKMLDICIFQAEVGRHKVDEGVENGRNWEVYRFLLVDKEDLNLDTGKARNLILDRVQNILLGNGV